LGFASASEKTTGTDKSFPDFAEAQEDLAFRPICLPTPDEKRRPRDVEFGSYACSVGEYIIVCTTNWISAIIAPNYPKTASFWPAPTR
jgi:hypothetical protein